MAHAADGAVRHAQADARRCEERGGEPQRARAAHARTEGGAPCHLVRVRVRVKG